LAQARSAPRGLAYLVPRSSTMLAEAPPHASWPLMLETPRILGPLPPCLEGSRHERPRTAMTIFALAVGLLRAKRLPRLPCRGRWRSRGGELHSRVSVTAMAASGGDWMGSRKVAFTIEKAAAQILEETAAPAFEAVMAKDASYVLFGENAGGLTGTADVLEPGLVHVLFPPIDVGPFCVQVRLTCRISTAASGGRVDVEVLETNPGILDRRTGNVAYQEDPSQLVETSTQVTMRWRAYERGQRGRGGLRVMQEATQRFALKMPPLFPVPDSIVEAAIRPFVEQSIASSQAAVFRRLRSRLDRQRGGDAVTRQ